MAFVSRIEIEGHVEACLLNLDRKTGLEKTKADALTLTLDGIVGDCHAGRSRPSDSRTLKQYPRGTEILNSRQVSIVSVEEMAEIAQHLGIPEVKPEWMGANLLVAGIPDFTLLPPSTRLMFSSGAVLIIDLENEPCRYPAENIEHHHPGHGAAFPKVAKHKRGVVARVEKAGMIRKGDMIGLYLPPQRLYPHKK